MTHAGDAGASSGGSAGREGRRYLDEAISSGDSPPRPEDAAHPEHDEDPTLLARRVELPTLLRAAPFPNDRAGLIEFLLKEGAPAPTVEALHALPADRTYPDLAAVSAALAAPR